MKNCLFFIGDSKEGLTYDQMRAYLVDNGMVQPKLIQEKKVKSEQSKEKIKSKIDGIAEAVKAKLKAKGIEGKEIDLMGVGSDEIVDALANMAKKLVDAGFSVKEAIDTILESAKERLEKDEYESVEKDLNERFAEQNPDEIEDQIDSITDPKTAREVGSSVVARFVNSKAPEELKERILSYLDDKIDSMSFEQMEAIAKGIVEGLGGIENAYKEAIKAKSDIPLNMRSVIIGEYMLYAQKERIKATSQDDIERWSDLEADAVAKLGRLTKSAGQLNAYIQKVYEASPYALVWETKRELEAKNKMFAPKAKENVQEVKDTFENVEENAKTIEGAVDTLSESDQKALTERIKELEKQLADLQKETTVNINSSRKAQVKKRYETKTKPSIDRLKKRFSNVGAGTISLANSPFADPEVWKDLSEVAGYVLESGAMKFEQFYKKIKKELGGIAEEAYADLYKEQKQTAIEAGEKASSFDNDSDVDRLALEYFEREKKIKEEIDSLKQTKAGTAAKIKEALIKAGFGKEVNGKQQVDWVKLTTDSKNVNDTIEKIKQSLQGVLPQNEIDFVANQIDKVITEKKAAEITKKVNSINRYKARRLLGVLRSRNKILDLVNIWKQGGLSNKVIQEKLGSDFGFNEFTAENEAWVENKIKEIELAPMGAERELLEEQLQAYLEDIGAPLISLNRILEKNKARLLSGFVTQIKNMAGSQDAIIAAAYKGLHAQVENLIKSRATDKEINKVIKRAHKVALMTSLDILLNGGVDTGIAISETTGTKEGSPRVRYMENERRKLFKPIIKEIMGREFNVNPLNWEKYPQRSMAAMDAFNQIILQEMGSYTYIKNDLMKKNPNMSAKQASAKAYEIMYSVDRDAAIKQAAKEFKERGIDISQYSDSLADRARFYRRVDEIIAGGRDAESVKRGQRFASRQTYKESDYGAMWPIIYLMKNIQASFRNLGKKEMQSALKDGNKTKYRAAKAINAVSRTVFEQFFPFVVSVGNIIEKGLEWWYPYGIAKSTAYLGVATFKKATGKDMTQTEYDFERAGLYATKAAAGMLMTLLIKSLADDDEEEGIALYGQGSEDWRERKNRQKQRPANTVRIGGRNYGLDLLGSLSLALKIEAEAQDALKYAENSNPTYMSVIGAAASDLYLQKLNKAIKAFEKQDEKNNGFTEFMGSEAAELMTRTVLPFTASARQLDQIVHGDAERALTFAEKLSKFSGIYGGWLKSRPAFDYRGKTYKVGEIYTSGGAGVVSIINQQTPIDKVDKLVLKYNPALTQISNQDQKLEFLDVELGEYMPMDKIDYYDFQKDAAQRFDKLINLYADYSPEGKLLSKSKNTEAQYDAANKEAMLEFIEKGNPNPNEDELRQRTLEIVRENKNEAQISRKISELNRLSQMAALEDYYLKKGIKMPLTVEGSKLAYDAEMEELKLLIEGASK
jgi:hypothetical protein